MKTELLLASLIFAILLTPIARAKDGAVSFDPEQVLLANNSAKDKRKGAAKDPKGREFRDTDPVPGNPHPDGKGKIISGIVIASVGGGIGAGLMTYALFNPCWVYATDDEGNYSESEDEQCKKNNQTMIIAGAAGVALGLGIGLPRMFSGIKERKVWKQWNRDNAPRRKRQTEKRTLYRYGLVAAPDAWSKSLALGVRFDY